MSSRIPITMNPPLSNFGNMTFTGISPQSRVLSERECLRTARYESCEFAFRCWPRQVFLETSRIGSCPKCRPQRPRPQQPEARPGCTSVQLRPRVRCPSPEPARFSRSRSDCRRLPATTRNPQVSLPPHARGASPQLRARVSVFALTRSSTSLVSGARHRTSLSMEFRTFCARLRILAKEIWIGTSRRFPLARLVEAHSSPRIGFLPWSSCTIRVSSCT